MAYTKIVFENPKTGAIRVAPVGFSWTVLFFGALVAAFRGDWKWFFLMAVLSLLTMFLSQLVFPFLYNKFYLKDLIYSGFRAKHSYSGSIEDVAIDIGFSIPRLHND